MGAAVGSAPGSLGGKLGQHLLAADLGTERAGHAEEEFGGEHFQIPLGQNGLHAAQMIGQARELLFVRSETFSWSASSSTLFASAIWR